MASTSRRNIASLARLNENGNSNSSLAQRRQRDENREITPLPPYEPPSCPLTATGRRALDNLGTNHNYAKYEKHIKESKKLLPVVVGDCNERLYRRREKLAKAVERRHRQGRGDDEKTQAEIDEEIFATGYEKKAADVTKGAEKAMRDLIDYSDELAMQETLMKEVSESIAAAPDPVPRPARRPRQRAVNDDSDEDVEEEEEEEVEEPAEPVEVLSAMELLNKAREDYTTKYISKTMLERYENNDYKGFKRAVHEALNPGDDAPPLPRASKWFPQDRANKAGGSSSRRQTTAEDEESDEDIYISGAKIEYKCPLSLLPLENPYTNTVCKHSYEKPAIIDYINTSGTHFTTSQARGPRAGEKQIKCVVVGCENMLKDSDFYDDAEILRNIKRAKKRAEYDMEEEEEEDQPPRGTQRTRPEELDESDGEDQPRSISKVKRERRSQGFNAAPSSDVEMDG